jgi:hypothetical protein
LVVVQDAWRSDICRIKPGAAVLNPPDVVDPGQARTGHTYAAHSASVPVAPQNSEPQSTPLRSKVKSIAWHALLPRDFILFDLIFGL